MKVLKGSRVQITGGSDCPYIIGTVTEVLYEGAHIAEVNITPDDDEFKGRGPWWIGPEDILAEPT
jgi:hypothetical protein